MRAYVAQSIDTTTFEKSEAPFLQTLERSGTGRGLAKEISLAMLGRDLKPVLRADERGAQFRAWDAQRSTEAFSALLKYAGDLYARQGNHPQALARYLAAWAFDEGNGEAAVYAAMVIRAHKDLDADGRVLTALIDGIFDAKGGYIRRKDWPNSLRTHLILGSIFEELGQWGPVENPRSAAFQWKAALDDERRILETDRSFGRSPGLYAKLGETYAHLGLARAARAQFLQAASAFAENGRADEAAKMRSRAASLEGDVR
jgi:tetratricopeptide (TPR) repeat protein